jgi:hypothetical protein
VYSTPPQLDRHLTTVRRRKARWFSSANTPREHTRAKGTVTAWKCSQAGRVDSYQASSTRDQFPTTPISLSGGGAGAA